MFARVLVHRLVHAFSVVLLATSISFLVSRSVSGDPLGGSVEQSGRSMAARELLAARHDLDVPVTEQFTRYIARLARADLGTSIASNRPVHEVLLPALGNTVLLGTTSLSIAILLGVAVGALQGWRPHSRIGLLLGRLLELTYVVPEVVLAIAMLAVFAIALRWFPVGGLSDPIVGITGTPIEQAMDRVHHLALPSVTLGLAWAATIARQQRAALLGMKQSDFIRSAHARGLSAPRILLRHAMPLALTGVISITGFMLPAVVSGALVVETMFSWPGTGLLMVQAIVARDYPVISAGIVTIATFVAFGSLLSEVIRARMDPRLAVASR